MREPFTDWAVSDYSYSHTSSALRLHGEHLRESDAIISRMAENDPHPAHMASSTRDVAFSYRCVCGEVTRLESDSATCGNCGRHFDYDSLRAAMAATAVLYSEVDCEQFTTLGGTDSDDPFLGRRLGHFQILSRLGAGGMGAVYRAIDESLQRYVALKVIYNNAGPAPSNAGIQCIFQEARAQARVNHPNVAHIYYVGNDAGVPFLAMELVGNRTLADRMADGQLPFHDVIRFGLQISQALKHAAMFDIVHGDIKPNNVLLTEDGIAKLSDFGLSRRLSEASPSATVSGTPEYVPPEITLGQLADHRSDMYSLGVTLFKMTFGRLPYTPSSRDLTETLRLHRDACVEFPDPWPHGLPKSWCGVLERLLEKDPQKRYDGFDELIDDLKRHEPIVLPSASPLLRGFAWLFDAFILSLPLALVSLIFATSLLSHFQLASFSLQTAITFGFCYLQAWWGTTPGKRLFQIRIVDQYGLRPSPAILGVRAAIQFSWAWASSATTLFSIIHLTYLGIALSIVINLFIFVEVLLVLFAKGRTIHDRILHTRVVLDAAPQQN